MSKGKQKPIVYTFTKTISVVLSMVNVTSPPQEGLIKLVNYCNKLI